MTLFDFISKFGTGKGYNLELAHKLGIAESTLYKYINKERVPRLDIAMRISSITGGLVAFEDMLTDELSESMAQENFENDSNVEDLL